MTGFADVFVGVREDNNQEVAVKALREHGDHEIRHRFEREVRILEDICHPGIVRLLAWNLEAEKPFYVMPLMEGPLTQWAGRLSHATLRALLRQFADVLHVLHAQGGIHRDFKPDNILVDNNGLTKLCDFGLSTSPRCTVFFTASAIGGTEGYAAPELRDESGEASGASDVYALGATMFHLATGLHPAQVESLDPWDHDPSVPSDLRGAILQMLHPDPLERPTAATVLAWCNDIPRFAAIPIRAAQAVASHAFLFVLAALFILIAAAVATKSLLKA